MDTCPVSQACDDAGACVDGFVNGTSCTLGPECASGNCIDDRCCGTQCNEPCQACDVPGVEGTCAPDPSTIGMDDGCPGTQTCNAAGVCE
jgi:hypothetical protein